jgi:hypothetical protein
MLCCPDCFASPTLKHKVIAQGTAATCDLCGRADRPCVPAEVLGNEFSDLLSNYQVGSASAILGRFNPTEPVITLADQIAADGLLVFTESVPLILRNAFLDAVRSDDIRARWPAHDRWMASGFGCRKFLDDDLEWIAFKYTVERSRRYVVKFGSKGIPNIPALLATPNPAFRASIPAGALFYRARKDDLSLHDRVPTPEELGPPDSDHATAGRANASGISVLYVADTEATAIAEIRPHISLMVHLAQCVAINDLVVFDMTTKHPVRGLDPFASDFHQHESEARLLATLNEEFGRPLALHVPEREYAPTQMVAELLANQGYDGIRYRSALNPGGVNYAFFQPQLFRCSYLKSAVIETIKYTWNQRSPDPFDNLVADDGASPLADNTAQT